MSERAHAEDYALVRTVLGGDRAAFRRLFDIHFPRLYRFAVARLGGERDFATDIVQQAFCRAIDGLDGYRGEASLQTWLCQICNRLILDHYRARGVERRYVVHLEDRPQLQAVLDALAGPAAEQPEFEAWRGDVGRAVQASLDRLPDRYASVLEWKYVEDVPVVEIAARLGLAPKAAESLLTRARHAFRDSISTLIDADDALNPPSRP